MFDPYDLCYMLYATLDTHYWLLDSMNSSIGGRENLPYSDKIYIAKGECEHNG